MSPERPGQSFYAATPSFDEFARVLDRSVYSALPDGWWLGLTDVRSSTEAIADGRYKAVNMAGAAGIAAVMNRLGHRDFPFVFGGDGAGFAVAPGERDAAEEALSRTVRWVGEDLGLELRAALVPVEEVRAAGHEVLVARFAASEHVSYAMFSGRGLAWAEEQMKAGRYAIAPAPPGARPDLTGLSCRWRPIASERGRIVSLIVAPSAAPDDPAFVATARRLMALLRRGERDGHPVPAQGPGFGWPPAGLELEARATRPAGTRIGTQKRRVSLQALLAWVLDRTGWTLGGFDPHVYRAETTSNSDFRKFDDMLRMTVDCDAETLAELKALLNRARAEGVLRFGLWEQSAALMTCIVPSALAHDHMHFLDGADGGYARAAAELKGA
jgi:hypothetical protein